MINCQRQTLLLTGAHFCTFLKAKVLWALVTRPVRILGMWYCFRLVLWAYRSTNSSWKGKCRNCPVKLSWARPSHNCQTCELSNKFQVGFIKCSLGVLIKILAGVSCSDVSLLYISSNTQSQIIHVCWILHARTGATQQKQLKKESNIIRRCQALARMLHQKNG